MSRHSTAWGPRLTAVGYALGSLEHAGRFALVFVGVRLAPPWYPGWRDPAFALFDATVVWVALRRPRWLFFFLLAFLAEQAVSHGPWVWRGWMNGEGLPWTLLAVDGFVLIALVAAAVNRWSAEGAKAGTGSRPSR
jgi:hypothetical protein